MQTPGSVHDQHITTSCSCRLDRIINYCAWVRTRTLADYRYVDALTPHFELINSRGTKSICRRQDYSMTLSCEPVGHLGYAGGLARAIHADDQDHREGGLFGKMQWGGLPKQLDELLAQRLLYLVACAHLFFRNPLA